MTDPSYSIIKNGATVDIRIRDVFEALAEIPDGTIDLVLTSPPFLALRSYLPADHPDKAKEIGSEANPAEFIDTLLRLSAEWRRVLAPHGSICVELGDTYAGSGGAGADYTAGGLKDGQNAFVGSSSLNRKMAKNARVQSDEHAHPIRDLHGKVQGGGAGWPLDKSMCGIPHLYHLSLAYGRNLLTGQPSPAGQWRVRNVVAWCLDGDTVVYARTPKGEGPTRLLHLTQNWQPGQWDLWDGERWTPVLGWSASEAADAIEIEFRNGERISATRNHQWPTQRGLLSTDQLTIGDVVRSVTLPEPTRHEPAHLPADDIGWLVGTFLADGSFDSRDRIQIAGHRNESEARLDRLRAIAESFDGTATAHDVGDGNEATVVVRSPILAAAIRRYVGGTGARNKCLRAAAWRRSNRFLDAVLEGYLDGDGHYDAKNERWRLGFTDNGWLARDLRVICARLGYRCRVARLPRSADPRGGKFAGAAGFYWRGEIRRAMNRDLAPTGQIVALRPSKRRRFFDVGVEGEPHLFALGSGILTHNCRPNPPVGALGDKVRPATSYMTMATISRTRYFDLDAVRGEPSPNTHARTAKGVGSRPNTTKVSPDGNRSTLAIQHETAGAPPLDWWEIPTEPYAGSHYATWPKALLTRPILMMCPEKVCTAIVCKHCGHAHPTIRDHHVNEIAMGREAVSLPEAIQEELRRLRDVLRRQEPLHVHPELRVQAGQTDEAFGGDSEGDADARSDQPSGIHPHLGAESPEGSQGLRPGASPGDGTSPGSLLGINRDGAPPQRDKARQPRGKPGDRDEPRSSRQSGLPSLRQHILDSLNCPNHHDNQRGFVVCGEPSRRIVGFTDEYAAHRERSSEAGTDLRERRKSEGHRTGGRGSERMDAQHLTLGWTDCGHDSWRRGVVLDPFGGSGTTAVVASRHGRDCIMIDLDPRNLELMRERLDDDALLVERETAQGLPSLFDWSES